MTASSRRAQLRQAFVAQLLNATVAEERVYSGRIMPIDDEEEEGPTLPAIVVHTRQLEEITSRSPSGWNGYELRRTIVSVVGVAQSAEDIDSSLDLLAEQVG